VPVTLDVWGRQVTNCPDCGGKRVIHHCAALLGGVDIAMFWAFLYEYPGNPEVFIDAILGTWNDEVDHADHETFGSRTGRVERHPDIASSLVTGGEMASDDPRFGVKLTRQQALENPQLDTFWQINDIILEIPEIQSLFFRKSRKRIWPRPR